jgi:hypothetical protein
MATGDIGEKGVYTCLVEVPLGSISGGGCGGQTLDNTGFRGRSGQAAVA